MKKALQISFISATGLLFIFFCSCTKPSTVSPIPQITFQSVQQINDGVQFADSFDFTISYTDGDGDIGLSQSDTLAPYNPGSIYYYDLYVDYYEKLGKNFVMVKPPLTNLDTIGWDFRMPVITTEGKNKSINGTISFGIFYGNPPVYSDTIMFKIYIYDRALHKSNVVQSPVLVRE